MLVEDTRGDHMEVNVSAVYEVWVKGKNQNLWVRSMGITVLFILKSGLLVYSAGSGVNSVQVILSGFSMRLLCFFQAKTLCM